MAYNNNDPAREASIHAQVSFKAAVDVAVADQVNFGSDDGQAKFEQTLSFLHDSLSSHIRGAQNVVNGSVDQAADRLKQEFGATEVEEGFTDADRNTGPVSNGDIQVKGDCHGALPDWLIQKAKAAGVTVVYDNRLEAAGTKKPLFKAADGTKDKSGKWPLGFWPN